MVRRKDLVVEELRSIRQRISKRLLAAERREGSCVPELRRMGKEALKSMRHEVEGGGNGKSNGARNGHRHRKQ